MDDLQIILHSINALLFLAAAYAHTMAFIEVRQCRAARLVKHIGFAVIASGAALSGLFFVLQLDWILQERNLEVGETVSWSWLIFDYLLGIYLFTNATLIRVFSQWKGTYKSSEVTPRIPI